MISIDLSGKCALITGGSQGIGSSARGKWIARAGASVVLVARNEKNLDSVAAGATSSSPRG
jgi:NAD(P)-dependent dehydrogenase (short-subunit alcohol dehydrogenase family)